MYTHSFTTMDASQQVDSKLNSFTFFDPKYDPKCQLENGSTKMNTKGVRKNFNLDINRNSSLCIETVHGITDLIKEITLKYGDDYVIHYEDVCDILTEKYKLSQNQAEYILACSYQGSIAGGLTGFGSLIAEYLTDPMQYINRNGNMSKIIIDKDNNLSYIGGQRMIFDCDRTAYKESIKNALHTNFHSQDYIDATIVVKLEQLGTSKIEPQIVINTVGEGKIGDKIMQDLQKIKSNNLDSIDTKTFIKYYDFANSIMEIKGENKLYKHAIKTEINNILTSNPSDEIQKNVQNLKRLNFIPEALSEILYNQIQQQLNNSCNQDNIYNTKKIIANDMSKALAKFIDLPEGYINRFSRDIVTQYIESHSSETKKKNIIQTIVSYIKDTWHGYNKSRIHNNVFMRDLKTKAKIIGETLKNADSSTVATNIEKIKNQKMTTKYHKSTISR